MGGKDSSSGASEKGLGRHLSSRERKPLRGLCPGLLGGSGRSLLTRWLFSRPEGLGRTKLFCQNN